jgi:hypothetical protein
MPDADKVIHIYGKGVRVRKAMEHADGFLNQVTGLGTARDKMKYARFERNRRLTCEELDSLYSDDDMAARVCDVVPDEELRQGYTVVVDPTDKDSIETGPEDAAKIGVDIVAAATALDLAPKMVEARVWGKVFGGGVLLLGIDDGGELNEPVNEKNITAVTHINVLERNFVWPSVFYEDPTEAKVGQPRTYLVTPQAANSFASAASFQGTVEVHESRLVIFGGVRTTIRRKQEGDGWSESLLQRMQTILTQYGTSWDSLAHMIQDANQGVYKMSGLIDAIASEDTALILKRMEMMDMARSAVRAVTLDAETEDFERQQFAWTGIKDPFELLILRLAAAARMPITVLMGQSPSGMNATGESDMRWFYDTIASSQTNIITPALTYVLRMIMLSSEGPTGGVEPESWSIEFPSLWQPTPSEIAAIELQHAQADQIYHTMGAASSDAIAVSRFGKGGFERPLTIDLSEPRANLEARSLAEDIEATPEGIVDLESDIAASRAMNAMLEIAAQVQGGAITSESGASIVLASTVGLTTEEAIAIVGEPDPVKVAQRAALAAGVAPPGAAPDEGEGDEGEDDDVDEETQATADAWAARVDSIRAEIERDDDKHDPDEDERKRKAKKERERKRKAKAAKGGG